MTDVVVSSNDAGTLNQAITDLVARTAPPQKPVSMLYERWARYASSAARQRSEGELTPVHQAFATAYVTIAKERGIGVAEMHPRIVALAAHDASRQQAGTALDSALERVQVKAPVLGNASDAGIWKPLALIAGGFLAWKFLKPARGKRG